MKKLIRFALLLAGAGIAFVAFLFSPFHGEPFPFGSAVSWALSSLAVLALWAAIRLEKQREIRSVLFGLASGVICGFLGLIIGVTWGLFWSKENLSPMVGFFVTGPFGFLAGTIVGVGFGFMSKGEPTHSLGRSDV